MIQAERYLKGLEKVAPNMPRALGLSGRNGPFDWPMQSEQAEAFARLKTAAGGIPSLRIPLVAGRALQVCADSGVDVATAARPPIAWRCLQQRTSTRPLPRWASAACRSR
jgi:hypothetical protein